MLPSSLCILALFWFLYIAWCVFNCNKLIDLIDRLIDYIMLNCWILDVFPLFFFFCFFERKQKKPYTWSETDFSGPNVDWSWCWVGTRNELIVWRLDYYKIRVYTCSIFSLFKFPFWNRKGFSRHVTFRKQFFSSLLLLVSKTKINLSKRCVDIYLAQQLWHISGQTWIDIIFRDEKINWS